MDQPGLPIELDGYHDFIAITEDFFNVKIGKISRKQWREDKKKATVFRYYDKNDMKPYYYNKIVVALRPLRDAIRDMKKI